MKRLLKKWFSPGIDNILRYKHVADLMKMHSIPQPSILDVGSGTKGVVKYLKFPVVGLDRGFNGDIAEGLVPVIGNGASLPFRDSSFDYVLSVDSLEHVDPMCRGGYVSELFRVAKKKVLLAVPCGQEAREQDVRLDKIYLKVHGERFPFLTEHVDLGLPKENDLHELIRQAAKDNGVGIKSLLAIPNVNVRVREFYMRIWISLPQPMQNLFYILNFMGWFWRYLNFGKCYRKIFVVELSEQEVL